jgi:hypothetical protein
MSFAKLESATGNFVLVDPDREFPLQVAEAALSNFSSL